MRAPKAGSLISETPPCGLLGQRGQGAPGQGRPIVLARRMSSPWRERILFKLAALGAVASQAAAAFGRNEFFAATPPLHRESGVFRAGLDTDFHTLVTRLCLVACVGRHALGQPAYLRNQITSRLVVADALAFLGLVCVAGLAMQVQPGSSTWIVVAAYNEAAVIAQVVSALVRRGDTLLVVDDGSSDESGSIAGAAGAIVITHPINLGQGAAL